jgi:hypothetical protein
MFAARRRLFGLCKSREQGRITILSRQRETSFDYFLTKDWGLMNDRSLNLTRSCDRSLVILSYKIPYYGADVVGVRWYWYKTPREEGP